MLAFPVSLLGWTMGMLTSTPVEASGTLRTTEQSTDAPRNALCLSPAAAAEVAKSRKHDRADSYSSLLDVVEEDRTSDVALPGWTIVPTSARTAIRRHACDDTESREPRSLSRVTQLMLALHLLNEAWPHSIHGTITAGVLCSRTVVEAMTSRSPTVANAALFDCDRMTIGHACTVTSGATLD